MGITAKIFNTFAQQLIKVLPLSPFQQFLSQYSDLPALGYLNWFFPVRECLGIMAAWLVAVGLFYMYSIIMRWLKIIGD